MRKGEMISRREIGTTNVWVFHVVCHLVLCDNALSYSLAIGLA
jgi:hypothetical protein